MKKQRYIMKIGVALALLLFSVVTRGNKFAIQGTQVFAESVFSQNSPFGSFTSLEQTNYFNLFCADDNSDDDDDDDACLACSQKKRARVLWCKEHFCDILRSTSSSFLFSSDNSPPVV